MTATADPPMRPSDEYQNPSMAYQLLLRLRIENKPGNLGRVTTAIGAAGGDIGAIDIAGASPTYVVRDIRIGCRDEAHAHQVIEAVRSVPGIEVEHASDRTFQLHRHGKIRVENKVNIRTMAELAHVYTPGVGRVSMAIHDHPEAVWSLTTKVNTVAVVTDGTAVLGLGDIGPEAALHVMLVL
jgi:malate dehydrogenase (oxaloacetate-decarboxylating)